MKLKETKENMNIWSKVKKVLKKKGIKGKDKLIYITNTKQKCLYIICIQNHLTFYLNQLLIKHPFFKR